MGEKEVKKGVNKNIAIIASVAAVIILIILLCVILMADSPKKAVETMFKDVKLKVQDEEILSNLTQNDNTKEVSKAMIKNLSWKILNEKKDGDKATVEVEVTNKDFKKVISNFEENIVKMAFNGESIDEAKTQEYLLKELNNEEIENVTNTHSITVEKKDGKWQVTEENDMMNIALPGLAEAMEAIK